MSFYGEVSCSWETIVTIELEAIQMAGIAKPRSVRRGGERCLSWASQGWVPLVVQERLRGRDKDGRGATRGRHQCIAYLGLDLRGRDDQEP